MQYWRTVVEILSTGANGKPKKVKEYYLVDAQSATEAESKVYKHFDKLSDFKVVGTSEDKIKEVI
jgi:hypothetical protein